MKTKHARKNIKLQPDILKFVKDEVYIIFASSFERHAIWEHYKDDVDWKQVMSGISPTIGTLESKGDSRPIVVSLSKALINGKEILFVDPCSQLVDYEMIDEFLVQYCSCFQPSGFLYSTNAENAHNAVTFVRNLVEQEAKNSIPLSEQIRILRSDLNTQTGTLQTSIEAARKADDWMRHQTDAVTDLRTKLEALESLYEKEGETKP